MRKKLLRATVKWYIVKATAGEVMTSWGQSWSNLYIIVSGANGGRLGLAPNLFIVLIAPCDYVTRATKFLPVWPSSSCRHSWPRLLPSRLFGVYKKNKLHQRYLTYRIISRFSITNTIIDLIIFFKSPQLLFFCTPPRRLAFYKCKQSATIADGAILGASGEQLTYAN